MSHNIDQSIPSRLHESASLYEKYINPQFVRVLKTIGFHRVYTKGEGAYLYDADGKKYLDFLSGFGTFNAGRNHPVIREALKDCLDQSTANMVQMDCPIRSGLLAEALIKRSPEGIDTVYFCNSGAEAIEGAIKLAKGATRRPRILSCDGAFHGLTTGALSLNNDTHFREGFGDLLPGVCHVPFDDLKALEKELAMKDVAAFVVEPIQGKGVHIPDSSYLKEAKNLCNRYGSLLIVDEIQTGLGRTGRFFAFGHDTVVPDIITLAKSLSGGYVPVGAVLTRRNHFLKVFSSMERSVVHSSTFKENDLAMTAGLATLQVIDDEKLSERADVMGKLLLDKLKVLQNSFELLHEVRGKGLMIALEFGKPKSLKLKTAWTLIQKGKKGLFAQMVVMALLDRHNILSQVAGHDLEVIKLLPPLIITEKEVDSFIESLSQVLEDCHKFPGALWDFGLTLTKNTLRGC